MFEWLVNNPWALWLIAALLLAVIEILTLDLFFIMLAAGAVAACVAAVFGAPLWLQVVIFAIVSVLMVWLLRPIALKYFHRTPEDPYNNIQQLIGQPVEVLKPVDVNGGQVKVSGDVWSAKIADSNSTLPVGSQGYIAAVDGATVIISSRAVRTNEEKI